MTSPTSDNPFGIASHGTNGKTTIKPATSNQDDLFGLDLSNGSSTTNLPPQQQQTQASNSSSASNDLLMLSGANPFIQKMVNQQQYSQQPINPFQSNGNHYSKYIIQKMLLSVKR